MTRRWPGLIEAALLMPLVCKIADAGTPYFLAMCSTVSQWPTVTGEPPSQVQAPVGFGGAGGIAAIGGDGRRPARRRQRLRHDAGGRHRTRRDRAGDILLWRRSAGGI